MELKKGYKHTELGVIPEGWEVKPLNKTCWFQEGPGLRNWQFKKSGIKVINVTNLENGILNLERTDRYISLDEFHKMYEHFEIDEKDIVVASSGNSYGKIAVVRKEDLPLLMNTSVIRFKALANLDHNFLLAFLKSTGFKNQIDLLITGGAQPNFGPFHLDKISICIPKSKAEQTAIATALSDMDDLINSLSKLIEKKKAIKQGVLQQLLKPKEGWIVKMLGEICDVRDGTHDSPKYVTAGTLFITSKNISTGRIDFSDTSFITIDDANKINQRSKVDKGDILMSMIGTIGNAVLIDFEPDFCIKNVALLKPIKIFPQFLLQLIGGNIFQQYLKSKLEGGIQKFISLGVLRDLEISIPTIEEQIRIATILSDIDYEIQILEKQLEKIRQIKQGMMQELLTGKTRLIKTNK